MAAISSAGSSPLRKQSLVPIKGMGSQGTMKSCLFYKHEYLGMVKVEGTHSLAFTTRIEMCCSLFFFFEIINKVFVFLFRNSFRDFTLHLYQSGIAVTINSYNQKVILQHVNDSYFCFCYLCSYHLLLHSSLDLWLKRRSQVPPRLRERSNSERLTGMILHGFSFFP